MSNQPQDPKSKAIQLLEKLVETIDSQSLLLVDLANEISTLINMISSMLSVAQAPAAVTMTSSSGQYQDFEASGVIMTYNDKGEPAYKIIGFPFNTYGVRVWPEVLPLLGIDPDKLQPGPNPFVSRVRALMVESNTPGKLTPRKIVGLATSQGGE
jgi:hypothetical protein